jgi:hypothetical protein
MLSSEIHFPEKTHLAAALTIRYRNRIAYLRDIDSHENIGIPMARPPAMRIGSACPSNVSGTLLPP